MILTLVFPPFAASTAAPTERSQALLLDELAQLRREIAGGAGEAALKRIDTLEMLLGGGPPPL